MSMENWMEQMNGRMWLEQVRETNQYTEKYGLTLSPEDTEILLAEKKQILKKERRVEFGESLLPRIIYTFCDSSYISQDEYVDTLVRLQEIFYLYKNEMQDEITDEELLNFMKEQFETVCFGDLQYLEGTCLDLLPRPSGRAMGDIPKPRAEESSPGLTLSRDGTRNCICWLCPR